YRIDGAAVGYESHLVDPLGRLAADQSVAHVKQHALGITVLGIAPPAAGRRIDLELDGLEIACSKLRGDPRSTVRQHEHNRSCRAGLAAMYTVAGGCSLPFAAIGIFRGSLDRDTV